jgi:hypothetical protein
VACTRDNRNTTRVVGGNSKGKNPFERRRLRWKIKINMDLKGTEPEDMEWFYLA